MKTFKNSKDLWDGSTKKVLETIPDDLKWIQKTLIEQWKNNPPNDVHMYSMACISTSRVSLRSLALTSSKSLRTETRQWALLLPYSIGMGSQASTLTLSGKVTLGLSSVWLLLTAPLLNYTWLLIRASWCSQWTAGPAPVPSPQAATTKDFTVDVGQPCKAA